MAGIAISLLLCAYGFSEATYKLTSQEISRFEKFHSELDFITKRVTETLGNLYAMHWPFKQHTTSRNQKLMPYHDHLIKKGACFHKHLCNNIFDAGHFSLAILKDWGQCKGTLFCFSNFVPKMRPAGTNLRSICP